MYHTLALAGHCADLGTNCGSRTTNNCAACSSWCGSCRGTSILVSSIQNPKPSNLYPISQHPSLYIRFRAIATHNEMLDPHLAKSIANKYLVYYNIYENTVFCDWDRLVEVESSTPIQAPKESRESQSH